jgi:hypothetical protein
MFSFEGIVTTTLSVFKAVWLYYAQVVILCFCLIPGAKTHLLSFSCKIQPATEHFGPTERLRIQRAWESKAKSGSGEPKDKVTSKQHGQPCKIDCSSHSLVGGGGSQPEQSMLVASFGGTKV